MKDAGRARRPGRWQRRILRATLPAGSLLLLVWLVWIGLPFVMGAQRTDVTVGSAVIGLGTALILVVTGYGYRRAMPAEQPREAMAYDPGRSHPFIAVRDAGLAAIASGGSFQDGSGVQVSAVATTNRYRRMDGCAVPGCGKPASAEIHAPAER